MEGAGFQITLGLYRKIYLIAKTRERGLATGMMVMMGENFLKVLLLPTLLHWRRGAAVSRQPPPLQMQEAIKNEKQNSVRPTVALSLAVTLAKLSPASRSISRFQGTNAP